MTQTQENFTFIQWRVFDTVKFRMGDRSVFPDDPAHIEQAEWSSVIPWLHRALANPKGNVILPEMPRRFEAPNDAACAYWEAALYLMRDLLGWQRPGLGLLWFYENQQHHHDDLCLELLAKCWNNEGQLDLLAAWLWRKEYYQQELHIKSGDRSPENFVAPSKDWWSNFRRRFRICNYNNPFFGGDNPLHLGHTRHSVMQNCDSCVDSWTTDATSKRATLILNHMHGWPQHLACSASDLVNDAQSMWRVNVIVKPVGWLGCFTKSDSTGRWHLSSEKVHRVGNLTNPKT